MTVTTEQVTEVTAGATDPVWAHGGNHGSQVTMTETHPRCHETMGSPRLDRDRNHPISHVHRENSVEVVMEATVSVEITMKVRRPMGKTPWQWPRSL